MRESTKEFVKVCAEMLPVLEPIYEFGSLQVPGQEGLADLRPIFPGKKYVGADMREGTGVDVILNLHDIALPSESVGTFLSLDTLEHVEFPGRACEEAYRILKPNGILVISSTMHHPIHDYPHDYWRFTPEAFKTLLRPFPTSIVDFAGDTTFPHTIVGIGLKCPISDDSLDEFTKKLEPWKKYWSTVRGKDLLKLLIPPILLGTYRKIRGIPSGIWGV
jgi:hypothetical protein